MTWILALRRFWDDKVVKYAVIAGTALFAILWYGANQRGVGRKQEKIADAKRDAKKLEEIEQVSEDVEARADAVSVNSGSYDDDRLSDEPLPDHHYRD